MWWRPVTAVEASVEVKPASLGQHHLFERGTLSIDARLSSAWTSAGQSKLHVLLSARAGEALAPTGTRQPVHMVLLLDRSESMAGAWMRQAKQGLREVIGALNDDDRITLIAYSSVGEVVLANEELRGQRAALLSAVDRLEVKYDATCLSCALDHALDHVQSSSSHAQRVVVLTDGEPTSGDLSLADLIPRVQRIQRKGATLSALGLGRTYNERLMSELAIRGGGLSAYVDQPQQLSTALAHELASIRGLTARRVSAQFQLAPGVRFVEGFDRSFEVVGDMVRVDLGDLAPGGAATALMEVSIDASVGAQVAAVTRVAVEYDDLVRGERNKVSGELSVAVSDAVQMTSDPVVGVRLEQSRVNADLWGINEALQRGDIDGAKVQVSARLAATREVNGAAGDARLQRSIELLDALERTLNEIEQAPGSAATDRLNRASKGSAAAIPSLTR